jgi:hypothetical protein
MRCRIPAAALLSLALLPPAAAAGDFGPRGDVAQVRADARRLLAHRVRVSGVDPSKIAVSDVVVVQNQALLSWDSGKQHGLMGLVRYLDRWWDALDKVAWPGSPCWANTIAFPLTGRDMTFSAATSSNLVTEGFATALASAASQHNADVQRADAAVPPSRPGTLVRPGCEDDIYEVKPDLAVHENGGRLHPARPETQGYAFTLQFARNNAAPGVTFTRVYGRAPTAGEMLANPPPPKNAGGSTDVFLFDLDIGGKTPVQFQPGSKLDIWFPFVLDDELRYKFSFFAMGHVSPEVDGTLFDNVLHFDLPAFAMAPGDTLMADVEGWW